MGTYLLQPNLVFIVSTSGLEVLCEFGAINAREKRILWRFYDAYTTGEHI